MKPTEQMSLYQYIQEDKPDTPESLQDIINCILPELFFKEFIFSENRFFPQKGLTKEFSDFMIFIEGVMIVVELKERAADTTRSDLEWLLDKIEKAKKQHKNTKSYWDSYDSISLTNHRGHTINIKDFPVTMIFRAIVYLPSDPNESQLRYSIRHNVSSQIGFIHIFHVDDFLGSLLSLITPMEISRYLIFREKLLTQWADSAYKNQIPEHCFIGQFVLYEKQDGFMHRQIEEPSNKYLRFFPDPKEIRVLEDIIPYFDRIGGTVRRLEPRDKEFSHYRILSAFATLHRGELIYFDKAMKDLEELCLTDEFNSKPQYNTRCFFNGRSKTFYFPVALSDFNPETVHISFKKLCDTYLYYFGKVNSPLKNIVGIMIVRPSKNIERLTCFLERKEWQYNQQMEDAITSMKLDEEFSKLVVAGLSGQKVRPSQNRSN